MNQFELSSRDMDEDDSEADAENVRTAHEENEDEQYIELNLGLGVLEDKKDDDTAALSDEHAKTTGDDALSNLMGRKKRKRGFYIQEV